MIITRSDLKNKAKCEILVEKRLDDMGIAEMPHGKELRGAAKQYYIELLKEHLDANDDIVFNEHFDASEGMVWGFVAGYEACLATK